MSENPRSEREPSEADRPPASRVGDELQKRAEGVAESPPDEAVEEIEQDALDAAKEKGWDKNMKDVD
jgi:hypothetical protein